MTVTVEADGAWRGAVIDPTAVKPESTVIAECDSTKPSQRLPVCWGAVTVPVSGTAAKMQNAGRHVAPRLEMVDDTGLEPVTSGM